MFPHPHNLEAERALLGGLLQDPERIDEIAEQLRGDDFYRADHQELFTFLVDLKGRGERVDLVTLPGLLERAGVAERCGGLQYVLQLPDYAPSTVNLDHYAGSVREDAGRRRLVSVAETLTRDAAGSLDGVSILVDRTVQRLAEIGATGRVGAWAQISEVLDEEFDRIEQAASQGDDGGLGLPTGIHKLSEALGGLRPGQLVILAARPGMGKTALGLNIAQHVSLLPDKPVVALFSLEMTRQELVGRMLSSHSEIDARRLREGQVHEGEWEILHDAIEELRATRVMIDDTPALSIGEVKGRCRKLKADHPNLSLIVIDYLQLMRGDDPKAPRIQQVSDISQGLKALAKDVRVPVLALSQLNRGVESRQDKRPVLSDLRESGAIEQDADVILFIYRDDYYTKEASECPGEAEVIIAKQRAGSTGTVRVAWNATIQRFEDVVDAAPLR